MKHLRPLALAALCTLSGACNSKKAHHTAFYDQLAARYSVLLKYSDRCKLYDSHSGRLLAICTTAYQANPFTLTISLHNVTDKMRYSQKILISKCDQTSCNNICANVESAGRAKMRTCAVNALRLSKTEYHRIAYLIAPLLLQDGFTLRGILTDSDFEERPNKGSMSRIFVSASDTNRLIILTSDGLVKKYKDKNITVEVDVASAL